MLPPPMPDSRLSPEHQSYLAAVMAQMLEDLHYPASKDGTQLDASGFGHIVAWHLVRAGWRKPNNHDHLALVEQFDDPLIKKRKVEGPGVFADAVHWVPIDAPDDPLAGLDSMTMRDIDALPEELRIEARRRLGMDTGTAPTFGVTEWRQKPSLTITDAPDTGDE